MHRIDSEGHEDNLFTDIDASEMVMGTVASAAWLNAIQEEIVGVILASGATLSKPDNTQLLAALDAMYGHGDDWAALPLNSGGNWSAPADESTTYQPKYRKDAAGRVWLRGRAIRTSGSSSVIGTLPTGFRPSPSAGVFIPAVSQSGSVLAVIQIAATGQTSIVVGDVAGATDVNLDGISFWI